VNPIDTVLSALRAAGKRPRKAGDGWSACCPAHDDRNPSLSISAGSDGRALLKCHAGCTVDAVCGALGLKQSDLFEKSERTQLGAPRKKAAATVTAATGTETPAAEAPAPGNGAAPRRDGPSFPTAEATLEAYERKHGVTSAHWHYHDAHGEVVGLVARWDTERDGKREKKILPASRGEDGLWRFTGMQGPRPLYALPELLAAPVENAVFVVEGEKAADATRSLGVVATTSAHGSKSADKTDWSPLAGREVVILPDHDEAGDQYAEHVAELAKAAGAKHITVVWLSSIWPEMPVGGDMADFLAHRGGDADAVRKELDEALAKRRAGADEDDETAPLDRPLEWDPFPTHILPEVMRLMIQQGARATVCDESFIALPMLAVLGAAIGNSRRVQVKRNWREPPIIWTTVIGESGTSKTPAFSLTTEPLRDLEEQAFAVYNREMEEYKSQAAIYDVEYTSWKKAYQRHQENAGPPPVAPRMPKPRRYRTEDVTTEALAPILQANPRGILVARDELSGWLASFDRFAKNGKSGGDSASWLQCFNGNSMTIDRKTGIPPTIYVPRAAVCITGGIQPGILKRSLTEEHRESGLSARMLFAAPPPLRKFWNEEEISQDVLNRYTELVRKLHQLEMVPDPNDLSEDPRLLPQIVHLGPDAKRIWIEYYNIHGAEQVRLQSDLAAAWSKLEGYTARLALVFHMVRYVSGDPSVKDPFVIDEASMAMAIQIARWFKHEARRLYSMIGETGPEQSDRQLLAWIERRGGTTTVRELTHGIRGYRGNAEKAQEDLEKLVEARRLVGVHVPPSRQGGRPRFEYRLARVAKTPAHPSASAGSGTGDSGDTGGDTSAAAAPEDEWGSL
jgi:hypothetical protein